MTRITRRDLDEIELGARVAQALHAENAPGYAYEIRRVIRDRCVHAERLAERRSRTC